MTVPCSALMRMMALGVAYTATLTSGAWAAGTDAGDHTGEQAGGLPQFDVQWFPSQLFWLAVTFVILYWFFSRRALPAIADTLAARQAQISGDLGTAEQLTARAKTIRETYERDMARARDKAQESFRLVDMKIKEKTNDLLYAHRTKVTAELTRAEETLDRERARLMDAMHDLAATTAAQAAGQILGVSVDDKSARAVVDQLGRTRSKAA